LAFGQSNEFRPSREASPRSASKPLRTIYLKAVITNTGDEWMSGMDESKLRQLSNLLTTDVAAMAPRYGFRTSPGTKRSRELANLYQPNGEEESDREDLVKEPTYLGLIPFSISVETVGKRTDISAFGASVGVGSGKYKITFDTSALLVEVASGDGIAGDIPVTSSVVLPRSKDLDISVDGFCRFNPFQLFGNTDGIEYRSHSENEAGVNSKDRNAMREFAGKILQHFKDQLDNPS